MKIRSEAETERRHAAGFDMYPPNCGHCQHMRTRKVKRSDGRTKCQRWCLKHDFSVTLKSICDHWIGRNGEELE